MSLSDVISAVNDRFGTHFVHKSLSPEDYAKYLGYTGVEKAEMRHMLFIYAYLRSGYCSLVTDDIECLTGQAPEPFIADLELGERDVSTTFNDESSKLFERAVWLWRQGRLKDAVELCNEYIKRYRRDPRGWHLLSEINLSRGSFADAIECARRTVKLKPDVPEYWTLLGRCHLVSGNKSDAISSADKAAGLGPTDPVILDSLGTIYTFADEQMRALPLFEKAVSADPDNPLLLYNLATCQRMTGQLDEAGHNLEKTIHINPKDCKAHYIRSDIRHWTPESNHIDEMERLLLDGLDNWQDEMLIRFALGKEKEDVEDYDGAFVYFSSACALKRRHMQYDVNEDIEVVDKIISTHTLDALQNLKNGHESNEPVFVLGLPRSGTTLVERIIGSHSDVHSAGELSEFAAQLVNAVTGQNGKQRLSKTEMVEASLRIDIKSLGHSYIEATRPRTGHTPRFIDKMPLNYLYCGLIHAALPNAKIITLRRNALDFVFFNVQDYVHCALSFRTTI